MDRTGARWFLRLFTEQPFALHVAMGCGIKKRMVRSIRSLDMLRGLAMALSAVYPTIRTIVLEDPNYAPHATISVDDLIRIAESA